MQHTGTVQDMNLLLGDSHSLSNTFSIIGNTGRVPSRVGVTFFHYTYKSVDILLIHLLLLIDVPVCFFNEVVDDGNAGKPDDKKEPANQKGTFEGIFVEGGHRYGNTDSSTNITYFIALKSVTLKTGFFRNEWIHQAHVCFVANITQFIVLFA